MMRGVELRSLSVEFLAFVGRARLQMCDFIDDNEVALIDDRVVGANKNDAHYKGVSHGRDYQVSSFEDIRVAGDGDAAPSGGTWREVRGIEVGHIFQLGTKYSESMNALFDDGSGGEKPIIMG